MLVKSQLTSYHVSNLEKIFDVLRKYKMKLNPIKCAFGVSSGKFLGFMVNEKGMRLIQKKYELSLTCNLHKNRRMFKVLLVALRHLANSFRRRLTNVCTFSTHLKNKRNSSGMRNVSSHLGN